VAALLAVRVQRARAAVAAPDAPVDLVVLDLMLPGMSG